MQEGRLGADFYAVKDAIKFAKGKVAVIVNSWEMASSCYRYKEQLLFALNGLVCADEVTVFVYSQAKKGSVEPGMIHRSGLGRLPAIASGVIELPEENVETEEAKQVFVEYILPSVNVKSVQPSDSKIKDLQYADLVKEGKLEEMAVAA
jgi:hypothetical protein